MADFSRLMIPFENGNVTMHENGQTVVLRAQPNAYSSFSQLDITCMQSFFPLAKRLNMQGFPTVTELPQSASLVIIHITRSKEENRALIAKAFDILPIGGQLVVDGAKTDGIDSLLKAVKQFVPVSGQDSKSHGKVFWLTKNQTHNPMADWVTPLTPAKNKDGFFTAAGMFSADGIDPGSEELAHVIDGKLKGRGADLGAGWGWLAQHVLQTNPGISALDLIEAENTALECAKMNVSDPRASFLWLDATTPETKNTHDFVVMNPPFHTGRKADPSLGRAFIVAAGQLLKPTGQLYLVANRQLAYEATLNDTFARWEVLNQSSRYKIIHARKPK